MSDNNKLWKIKEIKEEDSINRLTKELNINKVLATLLVQRGIKTFKDAHDFFRPDLKNLHDPFLMKDMDIAVNRIIKAINNNEKILIYGDYDVDGTTAVSMMYLFLKKFTSNIDYYIPDRYFEGYGLSYKGVEYGSSIKASLIITLDCGIKDTNKVLYAKEKNIDVIICDHHTPDEILPPAHAVLDPERSDCNYPFKHLSGCGVGFKLLQAILIKKNLPIEISWAYIDLVTISIGADIVPINGENRIIAYYGLQKINKNPLPGIEAIKKISGIENKEITIEDIVFRIGPRINAAGRIDSGRDAVNLLISDSLEKATIICEKIDKHNQIRKNIDKKITEEAITELEKIKKKYYYTNVLYNSSWHKGVVGIVASRIIDYRYRPTIILTSSNGKITGSARSIPGFDLYKALNQCGSLLENFGGHMFAAGLTLKKENLEQFRNKFEEVVANMITQDQLIPFIEIDAELNFKDITPKFFRILKQFEPFGPENMIPTFFAENVCDNGTGRLVGNSEEHLKLCLIQEDSPFTSFNAIAFNQAFYYEKINNGKTFDIAYTITENNFKGQTSLQLVIKDIKL